MADVSELMRTLSVGIEEHLRKYLSTDGDEGFLRDMSAVGGSKVSTCLILRTVGRKSGRTLLVPLLYAPWADEYIIVASKAGSDQHPAWYLNLIAHPEVSFQVKDRKFRGTWRVVEGEQRQVIWKFVSTYFPPYLEYQEKTQRLIPVVALSASERIDGIGTAAES
jgi:deazaflavin-dependent oxidoreductase (nitroreductase family)